MSDATQKATATVATMFVYGIPNSVAALIARDLLDRPLSWTADEKELLDETARLGQAGYELGSLRAAVEGRGRADLAYEDVANDEQDIIATMGQRPVPIH